jgi:GDP-L-fucose synthase
VGPEPINIGTGTETPIRDIAGFIQDSVGYAGEVHWDTSKPEGQPRRYLDVTRARERLGFEASIDLRAGVPEAVEWYRSLSSESALV